MQPLENYIFKTTSQKFPKVYKPISKDDRSVPQNIKLRKLFFGEIKVENPIFNRNIIGFESYV